MMRQLKLNTARIGLIVLIHTASQLYAQDIPFTTLATEEYNKKFINNTISPSSGNNAQDININIKTQQDEGLVGGIERNLNVVISNEDYLYRIVPGDRLKVMYHDRGELSSAVYQVSSKGEIYFPLIGIVNVEGLTRDQLRSKIDRQLRKFIRIPEVRVEINSSGRVLVLGAVSSPGMYDISPRLTVMELIASARYVPSVAKLKKVVVMRGAVDRPVVKELNLKKMVKKGDRTDNIFVKPGDLVYVPTTTFASINNVIDTIYQKVLLWYGLGGQDLLESGKPFFGPIERE